MNRFKQRHAAIRRIGLFGGTFNPIHQGHLKVAADVLKQFYLNHIYFIPSAQPPHKTLSSLASSRHRAEMVRLALKNSDALTLSKVEIDRSGPSYTIDTLKAFKDRGGKNVEFFFIIGTDAFWEIHTWKSYQRLFDLSAFILMTRPVSDKTPPTLAPLALSYVKHHICDRYALVSDDKALMHPEKKTIYLASVTPMVIASSTIRDMVQRGEPIRQWIHSAVYDYIESKGLYR